MLVLFCRVRKTPAWNVKYSLDYYSKVSGQLVNFMNIKFSKGILHTDKRDIEQFLQINSSNSIKTYMGCSNIEKQRRTIGDFDDTKRRLGQKLEGWKAITFSAVGKVVLVKSNLTVFYNI